MDISEYTGYFHDGSVLSIRSHLQKIELLMESGYVDPEGFSNKKLKLSSNSTLLGVLHLDNVSLIKKEGVEVEKLAMKYDDGTIFDLEIVDAKLLALVEWVDFPPKARCFKIEKIEIDSEKIWWENLPDLDIASIQKSSDFDWSVIDARGEGKDWE